LSDASVSHLGNSHAKDSPLLTLYPSEIDPAPAPGPNRGLLVSKSRVGNAGGLHFNGLHSVQITQALVIVGSAYESTSDAAQAASVRLETLQRDSLEGHSLLWGQRNDERRPFFLALT